MSECKACDGRGFHSGRSGKEHTLCSYCNGTGDFGLPTPPAEQPTPDDPKHVCGLQGYNGMIDPPCPMCELNQQRAAQKTLDKIGDYLEKTPRLPAPAAPPDDLVRCLRGCDEPGPEAAAAIVALRERVAELERIDSADDVEPCCGEWATCDKRCTPLVANLRADNAKLRAVLTELVETEDIEPGHLWRKGQQELHDKWELRMAYAWAAARAKLREATPD